MAKLDDSILADIWFQALAAQVGLLLRVSHPKRLRLQLYAARGRLRDERLDGLQIRLVADDVDGLDGGNLALVRSSVVQGLLAKAPARGPTDQLKQALRAERQAPAGLFDQLAALSIPDGE